MLRRVRFFFQPRQVPLHLRCVLISLGAVFLHRLADDGFEICRHCRIHRSGCRGFLIDDRMQRGHHIRSREGLLASGHFIQHHAERKNIAADIQILGARLLRRHIDRRPRNHPHLGEGFLQRRVGRRAHAAFFRELRQSEVENFYLPVRHKKNVCRLDVAMHNPLGMRRRQRVGDLHGNLEQFIHFHRLPDGMVTDPLFQALALKLLHHDERMAVVVVNVVNRADVRMVELRRGPSLARKAVERAFVLDQVIGNKLQRDMAPQAHVFRLVDHSHPAAAQFPNHAVVGHSLPNHVHKSVWRGHSCPRSRQDVWRGRPHPRRRNGRRSGERGQPVLASRRGPEPAQRCLRSPLSSFPRKQRCVPRACSQQCSK